MLNKFEHSETHMKKMIPSYLLGILVLLACSLPLHALELTEHEAEYIAKIKKGVSLNGKAVRSLKKQSDGNWIYRFEVESFVADIKESTIITPYENSFRPLKYNYKLSAFLVSDKKREVIFDWSKKTAKNTIKKDQWQLDNIPDNTFDQLSYQLKLLLDVNSGNKSMDYMLAHRGKLRESQFIVLGEEQLDTQFGKLKSIVAKKNRDDDAKRETYLWFSSDYPLLLLRMTQKEADGEEYEILLKSASINGEKIDFSKSKSEPTITTNQ